MVVNGIPDNGYGRKDQIEHVSEVRGWNWKFCNLERPKLNQPQI